ncbi:MAG: DUF1015 domain-containing protein [Chitinophagales bacterium]|nr:DUF1015 domain-containing protein [Chitinophagales bacterium]
MINIKPFKGLRPQKELVAQIACKPYDVLNTEEAKAEAKDNPYSFLRISKPEINFDNGIDMYADEVYQKGKAIFQSFIEKTWLQQDEKPSYYIYAQTMNGRKQIGLVAASSIDDYFDDKIKKHELTLPKKENDRIKHMKTQLAQPGMVFLTYKSVEAIDALINNYIATHEKENDFIDSQEVQHELWVIDDSTTIEQLTQLFKETVPLSYIADGHHRSAASAKVGQLLREENPNHNGTESYNYFLSCLFPSNQLQILDYNRLVKGLNGYSVEDFLQKLSENFDIVNKGTLYKPEQVHEFSIFIGGAWFALKAKSHTYDDADSIACLDVTVMSKYILEPILNITNQRTDDRIDFVGGIRGLQTLQDQVENGDFQLAIALYPVSIEQLMNIADSGEIMPPKSTWFEPKLKTGLVVNLLQ